MWYMDGELYPSNKQKMHYMQAKGGGWISNFSILVRVPISLPLFDLRRLFTIARHDYGLCELQILNFLRERVRQCERVGVKESAC